MQVHMSEPHKEEKLTAAPAKLSNPIAKMAYRPEIDGLRAVAVIPVIFFHAGLTPFSGGYIGVDVFFVISGYLITRILVNELERDNFSLARFYERRARRILPALFFVMACCIPFAWMWMLPSELKDFSQSIVAVVFFASNVLFWREEGYFAPTAELKPLLHTWSLAVEEQYYLLFPVFLLLAWRFGRNRVFWSICVIAVISLAASEWGWRNKPTANFYLAPTRAWELLVGSMCALWLSSRELRANNLLSLLGLALIVFAIFYYDDATPFPSVHALAPVLGTALIIVFGGTGTWTAKLLSMQGFVSIGLISYSAYLWHQPLFAFARIQSNFEPSLYVMAGLATLSLVLAYFSWRFVEKPFRNGQTSILRTRRAAFAMSGLVAAALVAGGFFVYVNNGFDSRLSDNQRKFLIYSQYPRQQPYREGTCFLRPEQKYNEFTSACTTGSSKVIVGDSHAAAISSYLRIATDISQYTASACPPVLRYTQDERPNCNNINIYRFNKIFKMRPQYVVLHANWIAYWKVYGFKDAFESTIYELKRNKIQAVIIGGVPQFLPNIGEAALRQNANWVEGARLRTDLVEISETNSEIEKLARQIGAIYWDPISELCDDGSRCIALVAAQEGDLQRDGIALIYWDYGHLTLSGANVLGSRFIDFMDKQRVNE